MGWKGDKVLAEVRIQNTHMNLVVVLIVGHDVAEVVV
jgi:hypothetical protein